MISLYIHIPYCRHKCEYCSFFVLPENDEMNEKIDLEDHKDKYLNQLKKEVSDRKAQFPSQELRTLYIGGGTPLQLGSQRIMDLVNHIQSVWSFENLEELSIELNPDPFDEVIQFVEESSKAWKDLYRVRYTFGIQTFDDKLLQKSNRGYVFNNLIGFLRDLQKIKKPHCDYGFDFIAFGQNLEDGILPRNDDKRKFMLNFVKSHMADHFSIYTLELFPGSNRYYQQKSQQDIAGDPENIMREFDWFSRLLDQHGYQRYELSNFSHRGHASIHNMTYRTGKSYLGCGINSSSYINQKVRETADSELLDQSVQDQRKDDTTGIRFSNTTHWKQYRGNQIIDPQSIESIDSNEQKYESLMMGLRLESGIKNLSDYQEILNPDWISQVENLAEQGLVIYHDDNLILTDKGKAVYNSVFNEITK